MAEKLGKSVIVLERDVRVTAFASDVGPKESEGPLKEYFDRRFEDEFIGEKSIEKGEVIPRGEDGMEEEM